MISNAWAKWGEFAPIAVGVTVEFGGTAMKITLVPGAII